MATTLRESVTLDESVSVNEETGLITNVRLLGYVSKNGREYSREAVRRAVDAGLYNRRPINLNHAKEANGRPMQDRVGFTITARVAEDGARGDIQINPKHPHGPGILWQAKHDPNNFGMSHVADGTLEKKVVTEISQVLSVDVVSEPATTNGLHESQEEETPMSLDKLTLEELQKSRPDLVEGIQKKQAESTDLKKIQDDLKSLREENEKLKKAEADRKIQEERLAKCKEAELPESAITAVFKKQLFAADEADVDELIEDRKGFAEAKEPAESPNSKPKSMDQRTAESKGAKGGSSKEKEFTKDQRESLKESFKRRPSRLTAS